MTTAYNYEVLDTAIVKAVNAAVDIPAILSGEDGPQPPYPYVEFSYLVDDKSVMWTDISGEWFNASISINVLSSNSGQARHLASAIRTYLRSADGHQSFLDQAIVPQEPYGDVTDRDTSLPGLTEHRAGFDSVFQIQRPYQEDGPTMRSIDFKGRTIKLEED